MRARRVLFVRDECFHWTAARAALDAVPAVAVVGEAQTFDEAERLALGLQPDAILTARCLGGQPALPVLARLRPKLPLATFAIIATDYDAAELLAMEDVGVSGYLLWQDLSASMLPHILAAATDTRTVVLNDAVARAFVTAERRRLTCQEPAPAISARERAVLHGLAEGLTTVEIALLLGVTERTVKRAITDLEATLAASDRFTLGMKAARLGLVP